MPLDAFASEPQYLTHLLPLWAALTPSERGVLHLRPDLAPLASGGPQDGSGVVLRPPGRSGSPVLVASYQDARYCRTRGYVYLEHGAGQVYGADGASARHPSYHGGTDHDRALLFLAPREAVAAAWRAAYPTTPAVAIGCPKLDPWHAGLRARRSGGPPTVAIAFHARNPLCPESNTAWMEYAPHLGSIVADLRARGFAVLGHGHPRLWPKLALAWERAGAEPVADFAEVLDRVDVFCVDNSSTLYEFASLGRPVVAINSRHYRRHVHHGLRFWDQIPGIECNAPEELANAIDRALADPAELRDRRERVVRYVYAFTDGRCTERAVSAVRTHLGTPA